MNEKNESLVIIWDDVVDLRQLLVGIVIGAVIALSFYMAANAYLQANMDGVAPALLKGYAMMAGLAGSILAGVITAKMFKPKRVFDMTVENSNVFDAFKQLGLDPKEEADALQKYSAKTIKELEQLNLLSAFREFSQTDGEKTDAR